MANQMTITIETGEQKVINIYDILDSYAFNKSFIIYNFEEEPNKLYGSILNETSSTVSLDPVIDPNEKQYIEAEIRRVANELASSL